MPQSATSTIRLRDGRILAYAEWGDPQGTPVLHFHGSSSCRLERPPDQDTLTTRGVRLITMDRPGHGLSDFQPGRRLLDWPDDVVELTGQLGIDRFALTGWSMGGPYVMACAHEIPDRITAAALIASFTPYDRPHATAGMNSPTRFLLWLARHATWLATPIIRLQGRIQTRNPESVYRQLRSMASESERKLMDEQRVRAVVLEMLPEAYRAGPRGPAWEGFIMVRPWGFRLEDIELPLQIWQGEADRNVSLQMGEYLRDTIPNTQATFLPGESHFLILHRWGEILDALLQERAE